MNMNPMQMMSMLKNIKNPQQLLMQAFSTKSANPMITNLMEKANQGDTKSVEEFARNFCKERGINFDEEFSKFMKGNG